MKKFLTLSIALMSFCASAAGAGCELELDAREQRETKMLIVARGMNTGLSAHLGWLQGDYYLKGRFFSQFTATPEFTQDTPLELTLDDDSTATLAVIQGGTGKWSYHPMLMNNREAQPMFAIAPEQLPLLLAHPIVHARITHLAEGERRVREYDVKPKHAKLLIEGLRCVGPGAGS